MSSFGPPHLHVIIAVLLGILSTQAFVDALGGCCPEIVAMSAEQRLSSSWLNTFNSEI